VTVETPSPVLPEQVWREQGDETAVRIAPAEQRVSPRGTGHAINVPRELVPNHPEDRLEQPTSTSPASGSAHGRSVALLGVGWGPQDDRGSVTAIGRALELGVNWIDTAAVYGHSEDI
jgi:hypothetical protein